MISNKILQQIFKLVNTKRAGATVFTVRPPLSFLFRFCLPLFRFPPLLPFGKLPLAFLALIESENIRHNTAGDSLNLILGNVGMID